MQEGAKYNGRQDVPGGKTMSEMILSESTLALLQDPGLGTQDVDGKVRYLLEAEYMRRLGRYHRTNSLLSEKYGMTFEEFTAQRVVKQRGYTWEVEKDAMDWEVALGEIEGARQALLELKNLRVRQRV
jgi:hypothetical protein